MSVLSQLSVPAFFAGGYSRVETTTFRLAVTGLVCHEREFGWDEIISMPASKVSARLTSVSGWSVRAEWDGVRWGDFLSNIRLKPNADYATFVSHGGDYSTTVSMRDLSAPRVMLVYGVAGEPLESKYGGPLRSLVPNLYGYKSCKWLAQIDFTDQMKGGYWEDRGYTTSGMIEPGLSRDINTGQQREIRGGEVIEF
jgi:DMSO/TMAO reductase YedYZ molybdopterin-dependent catalytic subunit